jgi:hypothetical protein
VAFEVTVRSQFDPNRFEMVEHKVTIVDQFLHLFLFDEYVPEPDHTPTTEEASHPRVRVIQGNTLGLPVLPMGPDVGTEPTTLGSTSGLPNYDTDFTTLAGMRLKDGPRSGVTESDWPASRVRFHYQVTPTTTFRPTVDLRLFSFAEGVNAGTKTDARLDYRIRLEVLRKNENAFNRPGKCSIKPVSYVHNQAGWMQRDWSFTLPGGDLTIDNDLYLRLDVICLNTSEDTCHIAFDHVDFPSYLRCRCDHEAPSQRRVRVLPGGAAGCHGDRERDRGSDHQRGHPDDADRGFQQNMQAVMDDGRLSLQAIRREVREARQILPTSCAATGDCTPSDRLHFWIDRNQDSIRTPDEIICYLTEPIGPDQWQLVRWTRAVATRRTGAAPTFGRRGPR